MQKEIALLKPLIEDMREETVERTPAYRGRIGAHEVMLMQCGIGKVNSALNTYCLIKAFHPDLVINSGVAGGADKSMKIGSLLVAEYAAYHDVWCGPGTEPGAADGMSVFLPAEGHIVSLARKVLPEEGVRYGLICSGDRFISTAAEVKAIKKIFPSALACDMESASIAQVALGCGVPFNIFRVVSDTPGEGENISQYKDFWTEAPRKTFEAVKRIIEAIP